MSARTSAPTVDPAILIDDIELTRDAMREQARATLGVSGDGHKERFRDVVRREHLSYYPILALGLLSVADNFQGYAFTVLTPDISRTLGLTIGAILVGVALKGFATAIAPLPVAALSQNRARRALLCIITGLAWSILTLTSGFVISLAGLITVLVLDGLSTGSVTALHAPLVMDNYPPPVRVRAMSSYAAFQLLGSVASPLLVGLLAGVGGFTWRGVFLILGGMSVLMTLGALGLRDPGFGKWDTDQLRASVREETGGAAPAVQSDALSAQDVALGFWEICRRMLLIPTNRRLYAGAATFGMLSIPLTAFLSYFLSQRWNLGAGQRGLFFAFYSFTGVLAILLYGGRGERQYRESPAKVLRAGGVALAIGVVLAAVGAEMPVFGAMLAMFGLAGASIAVLLPLLYIALLSIVPANMRPHAQALVAIFVAIGGLLGALLLSSFQSQFGLKGALVALAIPGVIGALIVASAGSLIEADLDRMIDAVLEEEEIRQLRGRGAHLPMLACKGVDFSYGQLQVLFGVDFTIDDGEMVALLGTNGAGKSTLLKVISGIGLPSAGSVRYRGEEITYLDAERRLRLGITQVPGGHAVFGPLTVIENLRTYGYSLGADRKGVEAGIDVCLNAFPRLEQRRSSLASTLSGGEQQMLGLSKALMIKPKLLLIDELSLGLAPVIVGQLLELVRQINAEGTAVVLVEQSVNIALNLAHHAYFMEKGEVRFDGASADLLARDDLLRAVFLQGAGAQK
jgi:ABC-type branched-subunit amino acid transport system ATPase component